VLLKGADQVYERFFGFREKPFSMLPDPAFLYLGRQHSTAYSLLEYAMLNQAGFTVITGEVRCGKTTLIRHLLSQLSEDVTVG
jgi:general secretion pathway protein A